MNLLVLTSEPITAAQLREAVGEGVGAERMQVMVVAPALHESPLQFWVSDADDAIARAEEVRRQTVEQLDAGGVAATGDSGEGDPIKAIEDALATYPADQIVLFTHTDDEQRYREDIDLDEVRERFGLPVTRAVLPRGGSAA
jgi:hypothetical protein